ncbi:MULTISPECIES: beta-glucosidase family protein [unclassified Streptomyces]|uniref:beta-glucosidase family protein n=1 Tax=unclassified Streptomyces TaxID=2593676 RepID=UPI002E381F7A|nr:MULTISPECIES: glycoside hydrolase family 3 C-terminal domain-containing protein [unclassified Streptomyces]WUC69052.1 glycoside hydrolase family 3 C-terminal domain-containing protein [Streptomyces sp. NBC_00539]
MLSRRPQGRIPRLRTRFRTGGRPGRAARLLAVGCVLLCTGGLLTAGTSEAATAPAPEGTARVRALVAQMTLDEKLSFVHWTAGPAGGSLAKGVGYLPGVPRLGVPPLQVSDGPTGVRINGARSTALPTPTALAATFDDSLATAYGKVLGHEGRALGQDVVLGPMVNTIRVPHGGRNFETFSEDPLVTARTAAAQIKGTQSQGLMATVKHFAGNNQESDRFTVDASIDEQTLQEIELPGFHSAVDAGAAAVMCSYNGVNGTHSCGNDQLLQKVLREQWGFRGWVMSDWLATHATADITKGLDQELGLEMGKPTDPVPDSKYFGASLRTALREGAVPEATLDRSVTRIVTQMERFGLLDTPAPQRPVRDAQAGRDTARRIAENGAVLLRNTTTAGRPALPLTGAAGADVAVIGDSALRPKVSGLGSAHVVPDAAQVPLDALRERAGSGASVRYEPGIDRLGTPLPAENLSPAFTNGQQLAAGGDRAFYDGTLTVPADGDYRLGLRVDGGLAVLQIEGQDPVYAADSFSETTSVVLRLTRGTHKLSMSGWAWPDRPLSVDLTWVTPEQAARDIQRAVTAASHAKTAVVFAQDEGSEGYDRPSLSLPDGQDALISAVAKANPNTVVVLNTGSSVLMPWLSSTAAVLDMWYPGQEGARATAALLYGDANPSGKLTQTFPAAEDAQPMAGNPKRFPGVDGKQEYSEGIHVGYRWYDQQGVTPLFPFGHGLSYTTFDYRDLAVERTATGAAVRVSVRNSGPVAGKEAVQVYLGPSGLVTAPQAVKKLAGYTKVALEPGEEKRVTVPVDARQLQYWNTQRHAWQNAPGPRAVSVGSSSADIRLTGRLTQ